MLYISFVSDRTLGYGDGGGFMLPACTFFLSRYRYSQDAFHLTDKSGITCRYIMESASPASDCGNVNIKRCRIFR